MERVSAFTGRAAQLELLSQGVRNAETTVVVGDAGIGKTRLVAECAAGLAAQGRLVVSTSCLPLAEQLPLLPVVDGLRQLQGVDRGVLLRGGLEDCAPNVREDIARLLPELISSPGPTTTGQWSRQRLFAAVLQCWRAVHHRRPLVVIVEDLHWSDGATRDLLTYISAQPDGGSVPLILTSRRGEVLDERATAAWWRALVSKGRWQGIHLSPLTPEEVEVMAASVAPHPLVADELAALVTRGEGNPFFIEQLLAGSAVSALSDELADLLRSRAAATTSAARDVLRVLAVAGRPLSDDELASATAREPDQVRAALRELVSAALARMEVDGLCALRHSLLGEAIESGLFAGERIRLHGAVAGLLVARRDPSLAAEAAHHLASAHRERDELPVRIAAAEYCEQVRGFAEEAVHWSRAVDLAEKFDDEHVAELALHALQARNCAGAGDPLLEQTERGKRAALRHGQPELYAALLLHAATLHSRDNDNNWDRRVTDLQAAVDAFQGLAPSIEQVSALIGLFWLHRGAGRPAQAMPHLRRAVELEQTLPTVMALATLAHAQLLDGEVESGLSALAEARHGMAPDADLETVTRVGLTSVVASLQLNRLEEAASEGLTVWKRLQANGISDTYMASGILSNVCEAHRHRGQIDQLRRIVEPLTADREVGPASWMMHEARCWADLCAGRLQAATDRLNQIESRSGQGSFYDRSDLARLRIELALWSNDPGRAVDVALQAVDGMAGAAPEGWAAGLLTMAVRACADLVEDARMRRDDSAVSAGQQAAVRLQEVRADLLQDPFADHPFFLTVSIEGREWDAELRRCQGNDQPELWLALAQEWDSFGRPHRAGYAWWRAARALLDRGQRGPAAAALLTAHRRSDQHVPLSDAITRLARLSRVSLPPIVSGPPEPVTTARPTLGLTGRELDVLRLLTEGLTNAEIGSRLYMSPKTASVHVTAILRKLQATNRVQAAAIAERLGLTST